MTDFMADSTQTSYTLSVAFKGVARHDWWKLRNTPECFRNFPNLWEIFRNFICKLGFVSIEHNKLDDLCYSGKKNVIYYHYKSWRIVVWWRIQSKNSRFVWKNKLKNNTPKLFEILVQSSPVRFIYKYSHLMYIKKSLIWNSLRSFREIFLRNGKFTGNLNLESWWAWAEITYTMLWGRKVDSGNGIPIHNYY